MRLTKAMALRPKRRPDDISMPRMNGLDATQVLRRTCQTQKSSSSARTIRQSLSPSKESDAAAYVAKISFQMI